MPRSTKPLGSLDPRFNMNERRKVITPELCKVYEPHGSHEELLYCKDTEVRYAGPAGTGKSRAMLEKANFVCLKYPGARVLITRKSRASMSETVLYTLESHVIPHNPRLFPDMTKTKRRIRSIYEYPNGSIIAVCGMDNPDRILSSDWDLIFAFEGLEFTVDDWEKLLSRINRTESAVPYNQCLIDCNPGPPRHWLNTRKSMTRIDSHHEDNPQLYDHAKRKWTKRGEKYLETLDRLTGHRYLRLRKGIWAAAEGMVYDFWDYYKQVIDNLPPHLSTREGFHGARKMLSIDFGYTNPFVCQWWLLDDRPDGTVDMYLYREIYWSERLVEDHAQEIISNAKKDGCGTQDLDDFYEAIVADWDAEDRATLNKHGIVTTPATKDIKPGIEAVALRMRATTKPSNKTRGIGKIYFLRDAVIEEDPEMANQHSPTKTIDEMDGYVWDDGGSEKKSKRENPMDKDNHGADAMRYAVAYVDGVGGIQVDLDGGIVTTGD